MNKEGNLQGLVEQFGYHADELSAQRQLLGRLPERLLTAVPFEGLTSIHDRYERLLRREVAILRVVVSVAEREGSEPGQAAPVGRAHSDSKEELELTADLAQRVAELRRQSFNLLAGMDASLWKAPVKREEADVELATWIYRIVLEDADELKAIGELFFEQQLTFADNNN
jgi:hypothetical protein